MSAGALDPTFGTGGTVTHQSSGYAVALQADGKIVTAGVGDMVVTRLNTDGTLDTSFGVGGKATLDFSQWENAWAIAVQPDGKILAAGKAFNDATLYDFAVVRYNADGTPDTSFGTGGYAT